jgi:hypothetical protein
MLRRNVSFTNLKFNIYEIHLVSVYYLLLHSLAFSHHLPLPAATHLKFFLRFVKMQESSKCQKSTISPYWISSTYFRVNETLVIKVKFPEDIEPIL